MTPRVLIDRRHRPGRSNTNTGNMEMSADDDGLQAGYSFQLSSI